MFPHTRSGRFSIKLWQMGRDIISIRVCERQSVALLMKNACHLSGRRGKNTVILRFPLCSFHQMACDSDGSFLWWTYHMEPAVIKFLWEKKGLRVQAQSLKGKGGVKEINFRPHQPCRARGAACIECDNLTTEVPLLECMREVYFLCQSISLHSLYMDSSLICFGLITSHTVSLRPFSLIRYTTTALDRGCLTIFLSKVRDLLSLTNSICWNSMSLGAFPPLLLGKLFFEEEEIPPDLIYGHTLGLWD